MFLAIYATRARGVSRLVLLALASWAGKDGKAHPSVRQLAARAGVDTKRVLTAVEQLVRDGEIEKIPNSYKHEKRGRGRGQRTHEYCLRIIEGVKVGRSSRATEGVGNVPTPLQCPQNATGVGPAHTPGVGAVPTPSTSTHLCFTSQLTSQRTKSSPPSLELPTHGLLCVVVQAVLDDIKAGRLILNDENGNFDLEFEGAVIDRLKRYGMRHYRETGTKEELSQAIDAVKVANGYQSWKPLKGQLAR